MAGDNRRLKRDGLAEVVCELRFESDEAGQLPELIVGTLAGRPEWRPYQKVRLPISDIPAPIRLADPNLKFQPILELRGPNRLVKIGSNVISLHALAPYPGWQLFRSELSSSLEFAFANMQEFRTSRIGFRFINTLSYELSIESIRDLNYDITLNNSSLTCPFVLLFLRNHGQSHVVQIRIASPEFVTGILPSNFVGLVDIDVYTSESFLAQSVDIVKEWVEVGHDVAKREFFDLLNEKMRTDLMENGL